MQQVVPTSPHCLYRDSNRNEVSKLCQKDAEKNLSTCERWRDLYNKPRLIHPDKAKKTPMDRTHPENARDKSC